MEMKDKKIMIVGAGLCGSLLAIVLAQKGYNVSVFEKRGDMREEEMSAGRSINLALSSRGIEALKLASMDEALHNECIPMHGRMVHPLGTDAFIAPYSGRQGEYINSISRGGLNIALLNKAASFSNVKLNFNHACNDVMLDKGIAHFKHSKTGNIFEEKADIIIGTDGAGSAVRKAMFDKTSQFNYSQQFLTHGYKELSIAPTENGQWQLEKNALHIWPRGQFMIIALPNLDGSFTVTMFHPYDGENGFNALDNKEKVSHFFEKYYPELIPYMPNYAEEYFNNPIGSLGTVKCFPWQSGKALIMGDAAHAIVPFYGQGMNASFEDVNVFNKLLETHDDDWPTIFTEFQQARAHNTNAIADLAVDNFYEMRDKVSDTVFMRKRKLETALEQNFQDYFSKYSLVTFRPDIPYSIAMEQGRKQDNLLMDICAKGQDNLPLEEIFQLIKNNASTKP